MKGTMVGGACWSVVKKVDAVVNQQIRDLWPLAAGWVRRNCCIHTRENHLHTGQSTKRGKKIKFEKINPFILNGLNWAHN